MVSPRHDVVWPSQRLDFSDGREQLEHLLDVNLRADADEAGVAELSDLRPEHPDYLAKQMGYALPALTSSSSSRFAKASGSIVPS